VVDCKHSRGYYYNSKRFMELATEVILCPHYSTSRCYFTLHFVRCSVILSTRHCVKFLFVKPVTIAPFCLAYKKWGVSSIRINQLPDSAARFCCQVAAWVPDMFCNFYLVKSHNIVHNTTSTEAREKINRDLESIEF
jgi:hypothetical protein